MRDLLGHIPLMTMLFNIHRENYTRVGHKVADELNFVMNFGLPVVCNQSL